MLCSRIFVVIHALTPVVVVSHEYEFVFVKTTKTAGTSIEACLSRHLPSTDSFSPICPSIDCHVPRNWELPDGNRLCNHMTMKEVRDIYGATISNYESWCIERHPVDKCISHFAMLINSPHHNKGNENLDWSQYIANGKFPIDSEKWSIRGEVVVDKVFDYELISTQIPDYLSSRFNILGFSLDIRAKSGFRVKGVPSANEITASQRKQIMDAFECSNSLLQSKGLCFE